MAIRIKIKRVLSCFVVLAILMSLMPATGFAMNSSNNAIDTSNRSTDSEKAFTVTESTEFMMSFFDNNTTDKYHSTTQTGDGNSSGDCVRMPNVPHIYLNETQVGGAASRDSGSDTILAEVSKETRENIDVTGCDVWVAIDDDTCVGYDVYVDGVYILTEGQGGTPDGYCAFSVTEGTHTLEIRKNGRSASKTINFVCGTSYTWVSMPDNWCEDGGSQCDNPPTVSFDKSSYYEGDTVQITVSSAHSTVYYEIKDCSGTVRKTGYTSGGIISYTIPDGSTSSCCYWSICFYWDDWDEGDDSIGPAEAGGNVTVRSYQCTKCYVFYVCPKTPCEAYVTIEDTVCFGYKVYVDGTLQFTEGQDGTPDGYCAFHVSEGIHTIEIRKDDCSETIYSNHNFQCGGTYQKILSNYWCNCNKKPDLVIQDISWSPSNPEQGDTITFTVKIKNQGDGNAGSSTVNYYIDGSNVDSDSVPALSAGSTSTQTFTWTANKCGDVQIKAVADAANAVAENNEGNNERTETVSITCLEEIIFIGTAIEHILYIGAGGWSVKVDEVISGPLEIQGKTVSACIGSVDPDKYPYGYIDPNIESEDKVEVYGLYLGNDAVVLHGSEDYYIKRIEKPDLIIQDISWSPYNPEHGDMITFTVVVKNQGSDSAETSTVNYHIDGSYIDSDSVPALSAGSASTQTFTWTANKCGDVQMKAVADANNDIDESEEGHNEKLKTLSVACQLMEGDVTQDGHVTITDARSIAQYKAGLISLNPNQLQCADTTDDGAVTMVDMMHILQWKVDPDSTVGVLYKPLWESPADDGMRKPVE